METELTTDTGLRAKGLWEWAPPAGSGGPGECGCTGCVPSKQYFGGMFASNEFDAGKCPIDILLVGTLAQLSE